MVGFVCCVVLTPSVERTFRASIRVPVLEQVVVGNLQSAELMSNGDVLLRIVDGLVGLWAGMGSFEGFAGVGRRSRVHAGGSLDAFQSRRLPQFAKGKTHHCTRSRDSPIR